MDDEEYHKKFMIITLRKHEERFNRILMKLGNFLREDIKHIPKDIQESLFHSMMIMVFINAIATAVIYIDEEEFEDALHHIIGSLIAACDDLRKRYSS